MIKLRWEKLPIEIDETEEIELVYEIDGVEVSVRLYCSCQNAVVISAMDEDHFPALPHYFCLHCDRVCDVRNCMECRVYNKMTDARDAAIDDSMEE